MIRGGYIKEFETGRGTKAAKEREFTLYGFRYDEEKIEVENVTIGSVVGRKTFLAVIRVEKFFGNVKGEIKKIEAREIGGQATLIVAILNTVEDKLCIFSYGIKSEEIQDLQVEMQYGNGMGLVGPIQGKKDEWVMFITTRNGKVGIVKFGIDKKGGQIKVYEEEAQVQDIELFNSPYRKVNATIIDEKEGKVLVFIEKGYGRMSIYMYQDKSRKAKQQQEYLQQRQKLKRRQGWGQEHEQKQKQKQEQEHEQERERERGQEPEKKVMEKIIGAGISIGKKREMEIQSIWVEKENGGHLCVGYKGLEEGELYAVIYKLSSNVQNEDGATENGVVRRLSRKIEQKTVKEEVWDIKKILELEIRKETRQEISLFKMFNSTGILLGLNVGDTGKNSRLNYWEIREGKLIKVQETHFSDSIVDVVVNENLDMTVIGDRSNHVISSFEQKTLVQETFDMAKDISKYYSFASGESGHENNENEILKRLFALGGISSDAQSFRFNEKQALDVTNRIIINGELDMQDRLGLLYYMILDTSNGDQEKAAKMAENYCLPNEFIELYRGYYLLDTGSVRDGLNSVIQSRIANTEDAQLNELIIDLAVNNGEYHLAKKYLDLVQSSLHAKSLMQLIDPKLIITVLLRTSLKSAFLFYNQHKQPLILTLIFDYCVEIEDLGIKREFVELVIAHLSNEDQLSFCKFCTNSNTISFYKLLTLVYYLSLKRQFVSLVLTCNAIFELCPPQNDNLNRLLLTNLKSCGLNFLSEMEKKYLIDKTSIIDSDLFTYIFNYKIDLS